MSLKKKPLTSSFTPLSQKPSFKKKKSAYGSSKPVSRSTNKQGRPVDKNYKLCVECSTFKVKKLFAVDKDVCLDCFEAPKLTQRIRNHLSGCPEEATDEMHRFEAAFQSAVIRCATVYGWLYYHTADSRRSAAGYPDLHFAHRRNEAPPFFAELKADKGKVSDAQRMWIDALGLHYDAAIYRPDDWRELRAKLHLSRT